ncbi:MAG: methyltransferase domain-containing protein [Candidatus Undinarchaeales archaeon]
MSIEIIILHEGRFPGGMIAGGCTTVLVKTEDKKFLIDFGDKHQIDDVLNALEETGIKTKELDVVSYTHRHSDHMGAESLFYREPAKIVDPFQENAETFFSPLTIVDTSGHSKEHASFFIKEAVVKKVEDGRVKKIGKKENIIIAGDAVINEKYFKEKKVLWTKGSKWEAKTSMKKIKAHADYIIPGHGAPFNVEIHNLTSEEFEENIKELTPEDSMVMPRARRLDEYLKRIEEQGFPKPELEPGDRVLDLGCGYCRATYDIIKKAAGGWCTNPKCYRSYEEPYYADTMPELVDFKCKNCGKRVDTGRVVGVDVSEKALKKGETYLRNKLNPDKYLVIRATENEMKGTRILKTYGVNPNLRIRRMRELDKKFHNRKVIPLYQTSIVEDLALPINYFDKVFAIYVLLYVEDIAEALLDILQILKLGGRAYVVAARPLYILKKEITPEIWKEFLNRTLKVKNRNPPKTIKEMGLAEEITPAEFYKKFFGNAVKVEEGKKVKSFMLEKVKDVNVRKVKKSIEMPKEPWPEGRDEKLALRFGYTVYSFYKVK